MTSVARVIPIRMEVIFEYGLGTGGEARIRSIMVRADHLLGQTDVVVVVSEAVLEKSLIRG